MSLEMEQSVLLARVPLFASLKPAHLNDIAGMLVLRSYRRGETIFHKDDAGSALHIVRSGRVKISMPSAEGEEAILAILTEGDFFGELAILDGKPRSATAIAMEATSTYTIDRFDLLKALRAEPEMAMEILSTLSERLRRTNLLVEEAFFLDVRSRMARQLLEWAEKHGVETDEGVRIDVRITQHDLASAIGATRESVNRHLGQLQDWGLISISGHHIHLLDIDGLRRLAP